jgi:hypothetical protein
MDAFMKIKEQMAELLKEITEEGNNMPKLPEKKESSDQKKVAEVLQADHGKKASP